MTCYCVVLHLLQVSLGRVTVTEPSGTSVPCWESPFCLALPGAWSSSHLATWPFQASTSSASWTHCKVSSSSCGLWCLWERLEILLRRVEKHRAPTTKSKPTHQDIFLASMCICVWWEDLLFHYLYYYVFIYHYYCWFRLWCFHVQQCSRKANLPVSYKYLKNLTVLVLLLISCHNVPIKTWGVYPSSILSNSYTSLIMCTSVHTW